MYQEGSISRTEWEQNKAAYEKAFTAWQQSKDRYAQSQQLLADLEESGIDKTIINSKFYNSSIEALAAEIKSLETAKEQIENKIADCTVEADRDGIVTSIPVKEMSVIQAGTVAASISCNDKVQAQAEILTGIAPYIEKWDPVTLTLKLRGKDRIYEGTVSEVYNFASKGTSALGLDEYRVQVKIEIDANQELVDRDGYDVSIRFLLYHEQDKLWIPVNSVFTSDNQDYVFVIKKGRAVKTPIETEYKTGTQVVINSGIDAGTRIIANVDGEGIYNQARVHE